jgi:putative ABC transport system substrate-binding protein
MGWMAPVRHQCAKLVFLENHQEREPSMNEITTIGLDDCKRLLCGTVHFLLPGGGHPHMRRREFITLLGGAAVAWPLAARAQQSTRMQRVGLLVPYAESDREARDQVVAFHNSLQKLGWQDGRNVRIDTRWTAGDAGRIPELAKELIAFQPDVILARSTAVTAVLRQHTRTIPIVFVVVSDPVGDGFVASIARPGGNATGFTNVEASLGSKWLELLKEVAPATTRVAVLFGRKTSAGSGSYYLRLIEEASASIGMKVLASPFEDAGEIERGIEAIGREPGGGIIVTPDLTTTVNRKRIIELTSLHRIPAVYPFRYVAAEGGLASYGVDVTDIYQRAATYVDRILRGEKPADLAVQAPTKFELAVNLKTAKALGLEIPPMLVARADEVIE